MTLMQSMNLGQTGETIVGLLDKLEELAHDHDANIDYQNDNAESIKDKHDYECVEDKMEHQSEIINEIKKLMGNLSEVNTDNKSQPFLF